MTSAPMTSAPMPAAPTSTQRRRPRLGLVAIVLGIIGAILCVVLVGGVWFGQGWAGDHIRSAEAAVNDTLDVGLQATTAVVSRLDQRTADMRQIEAAASTVAADPTATDAAVGAVGDKVVNLANAWDDVHAKYTDLRAKVQGILDIVQGLGRIAPNLPDTSGLTSAIDALDAGVTRIDTAVSNARNAVGNVTALRASIKELVSGTIADAMTQASSFGHQVADRIQALQAKVSNTADQAVTAVTLAAVVVTLVLAWGVVLHLALWALGRRWRAA
jgi:hypothetical protein